MAIFGAQEKKGGPQRAWWAAAKLTDFGIALISEAPEGADGGFLGTAAYLSPEQARAEPVTPASDVYSLGLVLLESLTGNVAFPGDPLQSAPNNVRG